MDSETLLKEEIVAFLRETVTDSAAIRVARRPSLLARLVRFLAGRIL